MSETNRNGNHLEHTRRYLLDIFTTTRAEIEARWLIEKLEEAWNKLERMTTCQGECHDKTEDKSI